MRYYTRRRAMMDSRQELEYIEFPNGGVCFASTYIPNGRDNLVRCKFKFDGYVGNASFDSWYYARPSSGDSGPNYRLLSSNTSDGFLTVQNGRRGNGSTQNRINVSKGTIYDICVYKNEYFIVNGTRYSYTDLAPTGTNDCPLYICDSNKKFKGRFYGLQWEKDGNLVLDWVAMRNGDDIYIYDKINKTRLTRMGTGIVLAGPVKQT